MDVQLEFLRSRAIPSQPSSLTQSLALFNMELSRFVFEARSDQSKLVDFTCHTVIGHDTRYKGERGWEGFVGCLATRLAWQQ